jgi:uncharacterized protein (DUF1697 family)
LVGTVALVVFLRGINVGGHRSFRPAMFARELEHLGAINIGAAGTFVIRRRITRAKLRAELLRKLPFQADIVICKHQDIVRLLSRNPFAGYRLKPDMVRFVSVLSQRPRLTPSTPISMPSQGPWLVKILARENRFVVGLYRRHMKVIGYLGTLDRIFGVRVTTRNWHTLGAIARALDEDTVDGGL